MDLKKMRKTSAGAGIAVSVIMLVCMCSGCSESYSSGLEKLPFKDRTYAELGRYCQVTADKKDSICWRVMSCKDGRMLLWAVNSLDIRSYNDKEGDTSWETCSLRRWLNNEFYNKAFNDKEKNQILTAHLTGGSNPWNVSAGNDTDDKVFCLSIDEVKQVNWRILDDGKLSSDYARSLGAYPWSWLRSPGCSRDRVSLVGYGNMYAGGNFYANCPRGGVRPAVYVKDSAEIRSRLHNNRTMLGASYNNEIPDAQPKPFAEQGGQAGAGGGQIEQGRRAEPGTGFNNSQGGRNHADGVPGEQQGGSGAVKANQPLIDGALGRPGQPQRRSVMDHQPFPSGRRQPDASQDVHSQPSDIMQPDSEGHFSQDGPRPERPSGMQE